jgi:hypothetical protein
MAMAGCSTPPAEPEQPAAPSPPPAIALNLTDVAPPALDRFSFGTSDLACEPPVATSIDEGCASGCLALRCEFEVAEAERRDGSLRIETASAWTERLDNASETPAEAAASFVDQLNSNSKPELDALPALDMVFESPLILRARGLHLEFASGKGVRYLAGYARDFAPLVDRDLHYVFEGLTRDGRYHVEFSVPLDAAILPDRSAPVLLDEEVEFAATADAYVTGLIDRLDAEPPEHFWPSLDQLDALVRTLTID